MVISETLIVTTEYEGIRADKYLALQFTDISRSKLKALLNMGKVKLNGEYFSVPDYKVQEDDVFNITIEKSEPAKIGAKEITFEVVYEDEHLLVINKPAGLTVHPGAGNYDNTLVNGLLNYCGASLSSISGEARPGIVHRLDKYTSGLMVVAKSDIVHAKLAEQLANREIKRVYHALIYGVMQPIAGKISVNIGRSKANHKIMAAMNNGGKPAVTHYRLLNNFYDSLSLIECTLETGRTHQIRVHMLYKKHPLIGDATYAKGYNLNLERLPEEAKTQILGLKRQALHAKELSFVNPITYERLQFQCNYPEDLNNAIKALLLKEK